MLAGAWKITWGGWKVAAGTPCDSVCAGAGDCPADAGDCPAEEAEPVNDVAGLLNGATNGAVTGLAEPGALPAAGLSAAGALLAWALLAGRAPGALPGPLAASGDAAAAPASLLSPGTAARAVLRRVRRAGRRVAVPPSAWSPADSGPAPDGAASADAAPAEVAAGAPAAGVPTGGAVASAASGGAGSAAGLAVRRLVVRLRGAAEAAGVSVRPDGPLLSDPSLLDPVSCSSLSSIRAISRQAPGRGRLQQPVRSARELVARDIPAGTCQLGSATGARYLQLWSSRRAPHQRLRCRIRLQQRRGHCEPACCGSGADTVRAERALRQPGHQRW